MCEVLECPMCEDRDCQLNIDGLCHNIEAISTKVVSGMLTCSAAVIEFKRDDYMQYFFEIYKNKKKSG